MNRIDSLIIGMCIIVAGLIVGVMLRGSPSGNGRYQIAGSDGGLVFVLDSKTGHIWSRFIPSTKGVETFWEEQSGPWTKR